MPFLPPNQQHQSTEVCIKHLQSKNTEVQTCAFTSLVPTRATTQKFCGAGCETTDSAAVFGTWFSPLGLTRDIHAISGKLSTRGTVRRLADRSDTPLPATTNSSHI